METTLIILKPDAMQRRLAGRIIARFEDKGLQIVGMKLARLPEATLRAHYAAHQGKPFYEPLIRYMTSQPVLLLAIRGKNAIAIARAMMGKTFGCDAAPGTIRGDFAVSNRFNLIHGSDSPESAAKELALFFGHGEIYETPDSQEAWIYDMSAGERV